MEKHRYVISLAVCCVASILSTHALAQESSAPKTRADCDTQFNQCMSDNDGFFGLFVCAGPYGDCVSQVPVTLPPEVSDAVSKVSACQDTATNCRKEAADDQTKLQACTQAQSQCVMTALNIQVVAPKDQTACFTTLQNCVQDAGSATDLQACASDLRACLAPPEAPKPD